MNRTPDLLEGSFDLQEIPADVMKVRFDRTEMPAAFTVLQADILTIPTAMLSCASERSERTELRRGR